MTIMKALVSASSMGYTGHVIQQIQISTSPMSQKVWQQLTIISKYVNETMYTCTSTHNQVYTRVRIQLLMCFLSLNILKYYNILLIFHIKQAWLQQLIVTLVERYEYYQC